jgi:hypothetical protein
MVENLVKKKQLVDQEIVQLNRKVSCLFIEQFEAISQISIPKCIERDDQSHSIVEFDSPSQVLINLMILIKAEIVYFKKEIYKNRTGYKKVKILFMKQSKRVQTLSELIKKYNGLTGEKWTVATVMKELPIADSKNPEDAFLARKIQSLVIESKIISEEIKRVKPNFNK